MHNRSSAKSQSQPHERTPITCDVKGDFADWLRERKGSVAISTYQAGKVAMVGWNGKQVSIVMRDFDKPMGMARDGDRLALVTQTEITLFANARALANDYVPAERGRYDALYLPRIAYTTGELQMHDLAYGREGLWAVNTRFSCLCQFSDNYTFLPRWQPKFITELAPEDRCHLNGLAMRDGAPAFVTALGETNDLAAWRDNKATGGIVMDVASGEIVCRGLSMPHSPRWYRDTLWVLNSGTGEMCTLDPADGKLTVICRLPGFLRGLDFVGDFAIIGMGKVREKHLFSGLPVSDSFENLLCGAAVVNIKTGASIGMFQFTGGCNELYDVLFLPGVMRPNILNDTREESAQAVTAPEFSYWLRPANERKDGPAAPKQGA